MGLLSSKMAKGDSVTSTIRSLPYKWNENGTRLIGIDFINYVIR